MLTPFKLAAAEGMVSLDAPPALSRGNRISQEST
jgi:hypothetical protein